MTTRIAVPRKGRPRSTARAHGLLVGQELFPSETVLQETRVEADEAERASTDLFEATVAP